jgi:hypothetical protein
MQPRCNRGVHCIRRVRLACHRRKVNPSAVSSTSAARPRRLAKMNQMPPMQMTGSNVNFAIVLLVLSLARQKRVTETATAKPPKSSTTARFHVFALAGCVSIYPHAERRSSAGRCPGGRLRWAERNQMSETLRSGAGQRSAEAPGSATDVITSTLPPKENHELAEELLARFPVDRAELLTDMVSLCFYWMRWGNKREERAACDFLNELQRIAIRNAAKSPNARTERQPPTATVERTRRVRTAARLRAEKRGGCSLQ